MALRHNYTIDFMRAVLILLVILVHIVNFGNIHPTIKADILAFMMPAFLLITGYLVNINKNIRDFVLYIVRIFLPLVIMEMGYMVVSLYLPVNDGITTFDLPTVMNILFVKSIGPYWFLHAMIVCGILYYIAFKPFPSLRPITKYCIFATLIIITAELTPLLNIKAAVYYFIGAGIRIFVGDFDKAYRSSYIAIVPFIILLLIPGFGDWGAISILVCVFCYFSFSAKIFELFRGRAKDVMLYIGRNTLPIYIFHPIFTMTAKFIVPLFAFDPTGIIHAVVTIVISVAGSIALGKVLDATRISYIFGKARILR